MTKTNNYLKFNGLFFFVNDYLPMWVGWAWFLFIQIVLS